MTKTREPTYEEREIRQRAADTKRYIKLLEEDAQFHLEQCERAKAKLARDPDSQFDDDEGMQNAADELYQEHETLADMDADLAQAERETAEYARRKR